MPNWMTRQILRLFPIKPRTIDDFIATVRENGCRKVTIEPETKVRGGAFSTTVGHIGNYQYALKASAQTPDGRKVIYSHTEFERFGSSAGFADSDDRRRAAIRLFLWGERGQKYLEEELPGVTIELIGPFGRPMDEGMFVKLHQDADVMGVAI